MRRSVLAFLLRGDEVLLAKKREGRTGIGLWTAYGGKVGQRESVKGALVREVREESTLVVEERHLVSAGLVRTYHNLKPLFLIRLFTCRLWKGEPRDTEEMWGARFFHFDRLPLQEMREGDREWFPRVLRGEKFEADVHVGPADKLVRRVSYQPRGLVDGLAL